MAREGFETVGKRTIVSPFCKQAIVAMPKALSPPPEGSIATKMCLTGTGSGLTRDINSSTDGCLNARVVDSAVTPIDSRKRRAGSSACAQQRRMWGHGPQSQDMWGYQGRQKRVPVGPVHNDT